MITRRIRRAPFAALVTGAALVLVLAAAPPVGAAAQLTRDGWWAQNDPGVPAVPADAVAIAAVAGTVQKVAAYDIDLGLPAGAVIDNVTFTVAEAPGSVAAAQGKLTACVITKPWVAVHKGAWAQVPTWDCTAGAGESIRGADGVWTFDLTNIARAWQSRVTPRGVAVIPSPGSTASFQVHLAGVTGTGARLRVVMAAEPTAGPAQDTPSADSPPADFGGNASPGFESGGFSSGALDLPPLPPSTEASPPPVAPADPVVVLAAPAAARPLAATGAKDGHLFGNYSLTTLLLVPLVLGLVAALATALGPEGDPKGLRRREGGVSRALARRAAADPNRQEHR